MTSLLNDSLSDASVAKLLNGMNNGDFLQKTLINNFGNIISQYPHSALASKAATVLSAQVDSLVNVGSNKIVIRANIDEKTLRYFRERYPMFEIVCSPYPDEICHAKSALVRKFELALIYKDIDHYLGDTPLPSNYSASIVDVGGKLVQHMEKEYTVHVCMGDADNKDIHRTPRSLLNMVSSRKQRALIQTNVCNNFAQDCSVKAPVCIFLHSSYDMSTVDIADIMWKKMAILGFISLLYDPLIILEEFSEGYIADQECYWKKEKRNGKKVVVFSFKDGAIDYVHDLANYVRILTVPIIFSSYGVAYTLEPKKPICGTVRLVVVPAITSVQSFSGTLSLDCSAYDDDVMVSFLEFSPTMFESESFMKNLTSPTQKFKNHLARMKRVYQIFPSSLFYDAVLQALNFLKSPDTDIVSKLMSYVKTRNTAFVINVTAVATQNKCSPWVLSQLVIASIQCAFVLRYEMVNSFKSHTVLENGVRKGGPPLGFFTRLYCSIFSIDPLEFSIGKLNLGSVDDRLNSRQERVKEIITFFKPLVSKVQVNVKFSIDQRHLKEASSLKHYVASVMQPTPSEAGNNSYPSEITQDDLKVFVENDQVFAVTYEKPEPEPVTPEVQKCYITENFCGVDADYNLIEEQVPGDGFCGFHALSKYLGLNLIEAIKLIAPKGSVVPEVDKDLKALSSSISSGSGLTEGCWITHSEIEGVLADFGMAVCYHSREDVKEGFQLPCEFDHKGVVHLRYFNNHFTVLRYSSSQKLIKIPLSRFSDNSSYYSLPLESFDATLPNDYSNKDVLDIMKKDRAFAEFRRNEFNEIHRRWLKVGTNGIDQIKEFHQIDEEDVRLGRPELDKKYMDKTFILKIPVDELVNYLDAINQCASCFEEIYIDSPPSVSFAHKTVYVVFYKMISHVAETFELYSEAYLKNVDRVISTRRYNVLRKFFKSKDLLNSRAGFLDQVYQVRESKKVYFSEVTVTNLFQALTSGSPSAFLEALLLYRPDITYKIVNSKLFSKLRDAGIKNINSVVRASNDLITASKRVFVPKPTPREPEPVFEIFVNSYHHEELDISIVEYCTPYERTAVSSPVHRFYRDVPIQQPKASKCKLRRRKFIRYIHYAFGLREAYEKKIHKKLSQKRDEKFNEEPALKPVLPFVEKEFKNINVENVRQKLLNDFINNFNENRSEEKCSLSSGDPSKVEPEPVKVGDFMPFSVDSDESAVKKASDGALTSCLDTRELSDVQKCVEEYKIINDFVSKTSDDAVKHFFSTIGTYVQDPLHTQWNLTPDAKHHVNEIYPTLGVISKKILKDGTTGYVITKMPNERYRTDITSVGYVYNEQAKLIDIHSYFSSDKDLMNAVFHCDTFYNLPKRMVEVINDSKVHNFDLTVVNGGPGTGKTTDLIARHVVNKHLVMAVSKGAITNIIDRVNKKHSNSQGFRLNRDLYRTLDSFLMKPNVEVDEIHVDECFMVHFGAIVAAIKLSKAKRVTLYGDQKQTTYSCRIPVLGPQIKYFSMPDSLNKNVIFKTKSYRCPRDVCQIPSIKNIYKDSGCDQEFVSVSSVTKSIKTMLIADVNEVPIDKTSVYMTFTKAERQELQRFLGEDYSVFTIGGYQGNENPKVTLVRTNPLDACPLFTDMSQIFVGLTRHTKEFLYCTVKSDFLNQMLSRGGYTHSGYVHVERPFEINGQKFAQGDRSPEFELYSRLMNEFGNHSNIDDDNITFQIMPENPLEIMEPDHDPDISVLQDGYENLAGPENALLDNTYYNQFALEDPKNLNLAKGKISMAKYGLTNDKDSPEFGIKPLLRTSCPRKADTSLVSLSAAIKERNNGVPELAMPLDHVSLSQVTVERFFKCFIDDRRYAFQNVDVIRPNPGSFKDWISVQDSGIINKYNEITSVLNFNDMRTFELSLKRSPKPKLDPNSYKKRPMPQVIAASCKEINAIFSPVLRRMSTRVINSLRDGVFINSGFCVEEFEEKITHRINPKALIECDVIEIDLSKFDKSQDYLALLIDCRFMIAFGVDPEMVKLWFFLHVITILYNRMHSMKQIFAFQRKSGDPLTFLGNTLLTMATVALYSNAEDSILGMFAGDDSLLFFSRGVAKSNLSYIPDTFNFEVKEFKFKSLYFCSKFLIPCGDRWYFVSDLYKVLEKLGRHDLVNWEHVEEYRISLIDTLRSLFYEELIPTLSYYLHERYGSTMTFDYVLKTLLGFLSSRESFARLFSDEGQELLPRNCDRPKLIERYTKNLSMVSVISKSKLFIKLNRVSMPRTEQRDDIHLD
jgi:hypothetical protein